MNRCRAVLLTVVCAFAASAWGQEGKVPTPEDPAHQELREFRQQVVDAINEHDVDRLMTYLADDVIVTWQNAEVSRTPAGVRAYYDKMMLGDDPIVAEMTTDPIPTELTHLYGDTGVSQGSSEDHFVLTDGREFTVNTLWTATLVRSNGAWKIAGFHASANMFDNPILWIAVRRTAIWTGVAAGLVGILVGALIVYALRKRVPPNAAR
ncbi:MAG: nuclear transport factor 2 family protein [Pirellulales bacterium]